MQRATRIFGTHWFHRRFTLAPDGRYVTVTELAEWARGPYDQLRKNLLLNADAGGDAPRVILMAPVRHGDGATTTAVLLAASLASTHRTLVVDLNFRRPGVAAALDLDGAPGLATVFRNGGTTAVGPDLERAVVPTRIPQMFALPNAIDGSQRVVPEIGAVRAIMEQLRERFDFIVLDSAPLLSYPDTALFGTLADAVLLVMAADSTPVDAGLEARQELARGGVEVTGAVLTRQRQFIPEVINRHLRGA
jgi:Mrp family chromosome partitioning ATPase